MKRLFIYLKINDKKLLLRTVTVHSSFVGIGKLGTINTSEFKKLSEDLEPTSNHYAVVDA